MFHRTSENPFEEEALPKAYYFPSLEKHLSARLRKTYLSPKKETNDTKTTCKADERFLRESNRLEVPTREDGTTHHELSSGSQFDESWPSTDRNVSSLSQPTLSSSTLTEKEKDHLAVNKILNEDDIENRLPRPSTLSKYVERFRHGAPSSRQDRQDSLSSDFWWLSPPSNTSTPKETSSLSNSELGNEISSKVRQDATCASPLRQRHSCTREAARLAEGVKMHELQLQRNQFSCPGKEATEAVYCQTTDLVARTNQLLEKSETLSEASSSDSIPKAPSSWMLEKQKRLGNALESRSSVTKPRIAREDDILYQWRLARRLEKAQEHVKDGQHHSSSGNRATIISTIRNSTHFPEQGQSKYHTHSEDRRSENTSIRHVGRMPNKTSEMEKVVQHTNYESWRNHVNVLGKYARDSNSKEESIERHQKSGATEMFRLESHEEKVPRHVHSMCDIMPCSKQMCSQPTRLDVGTQCSSVSDLNKPSTEPPHRNRTEETDLIEDQHDLQITSSSGVHDTAAASSVTSELATQVSRSEINAKENKREEIETSDKHANLSTTKQLLSANSETVETDTPLHLQTIAQSRKDNQDIKYIARRAAQDLLHDKVSKTDNIGSKSGPNTSDDVNNPVTGPVVSLSPFPHQGSEKDRPANMQHNEVIGTVIGQVISERLFSTSVSHCSSLSDEYIECGSVEERNGADAIGADCENHIENEMTQKLHTITATHDASLFCDDDMLIRLRQQAEYYRKHIRNINRILELMEG